MANRMTPRQEEVARYVGQHLSNAEIAERMGLTESTVKTHVRNLKSFLGVRKRREIPAAAARYGVK